MSLRQQKGWQASDVNIARTDQGLTAWLSSFRGNIIKPRITRRLVDAGADTTSAVQLRSQHIRTCFNVTPMEFLNDWTRRENSGEHPATDEQLLEVEAVRRLLLQAVAVHAVSWLWPSDAPLLARNAQSPTTTKHSPTPLTTMLPVLRRKARRPAILSETLFRWAVTRFFDRRVERLY